MQELAAQGDLLWCSESAAGDIQGLERSSVERAWEGAEVCVVEGSAEMLEGLEGSISFPVEAVWVRQRHLPIATTSTTACT